MDDSWYFKDQGECLCQRPRDEVSVFPQYTQFAVSDCISNNNSLDGLRGICDESDSGSSLSEFQLRSDHSSPEYLDCDGELIQGTFTGKTVKKDPNAPFLSDEIMQQKEPEVLSTPSTFRAIDSYKSFLAVKETDYDAEPLQWKSEKDKCVGKFNSLHDIYWKVMKVYIAHRRSHKKIKFAKVSPASDLFVIERTFSGEFVSLKVQETVDKFLQNLFEIDDFALIGTKSLRHKCMGCLVDGFTVLRLLCADLRMLYDCICAEALEFDVEMYAKRHFLEIIKKKEKLVSVCETAKSEKATSQAAASLRTLLSA